MKSLSTVISESFITWSDVDCYTFTRKYDGDYLGCLEVVKWHSHILLHIVSFFDWPKKYALFVDQSWLHYKNMAHLIYQHSLSRFGQKVLLFDLNQKFYYF